MNNPFFKLPVEETYQQLLTLHSELPQGMKKEYIKTPCYCADCNARRVEESRTYLQFEICVHLGKVVPILNN